MKVNDGEAARGQVAAGTRGQVPSDGEEYSGNDFIRKANCTEKPGEYPCNRLQKT